MKVLFDYQTFTEQQFGGISRYISEIISVIRKVMGYGRTPTDNSKSFIPNTSKLYGYHEKNFWKIRLDTTREVMKIELRKKYNLCARNLFTEFKIILYLS